MNKIWLILIALISLAGCSTTTVSPINTPSTDAHQPGKFVWHDLFTQHPEKAKAFYGKLFGWTFDNQDKYSTIYYNKKAIGGMLKVLPKKGNLGTARWISSVSVIDVDSIANAFKQQGGIIHEGPMDLADRGRWALVTDPQGAQLALVYSSSGDPIDTTPQINSWLWHELWTKEATASLQFYANTIGYKTEKIFPQYWALKQNDQLLAGLRSLPETSYEPRWVPVVRVSDPAATAQQAVSLGGKLLIRSKNKDIQDAILLSDPDGALIIVQRWQQAGAE